MIIQAVLKTKYSFQVHQSNEYTMYRKHPHKMHTFDHFKWIHLTGELSSGRLGKCLGYGYQIIQSLIARH